WARASARAGTRRLRASSTGVYGTRRPAQRSNPRGTTESARGRQRASGEALEDRKRRALRLIERRKRQVNRLFEHVLARNRRMHDLVRKAEPCRSRLEARRFLLAIALIGEIGLRGVVKTEHQMVVLGANPFRRANCCEHRRRAGQRTRNAR